MSAIKSLSRTPGVFAQSSANGKSSVAEWNASGIAIIAVSPVV
jgi:hypothetical protein